MKQICIILLMMCSFNLSFAVDEQIESDKQLHFGVSAGISAATYATMDAYKYTKTQAVLGSLGVAVAVGVGKEISDSQQVNNRFDSEDLVYDVLGALTGTFLTWTF